MVTAPYLLKYFAGAIPRNSLRSTKVSQIQSPSLHDQDAFDSSGSDPFRSSDR